MELLRVKVVFGMFVVLFSIIGLQDSLFVSAETTNAVNLVQRVELGRDDIYFESKSELIELDENLLDSGGLLLIEDEIDKFSFDISYTNEIEEMDNSDEEIESQEESEIDIFSEEFSALDIDEKFEILKQVYQHGHYFNTTGTDTSGMSENEILMLTSEIPCDHWNYGCIDCQIYNGATFHSFNFSVNMQCLAFASLISDLLFGADSEVIEFYETDDIKVGDHIRLISQEHSMIVTEINGDEFTVAEVNEDYETCEISWGRVITKSEIESTYYILLTRE